MRAAARTLPVQCLLLAGAVCLYHIGLRDYLSRTGLLLGALRERHLVPLLAVPDVYVSLWLVPAVLVVAAFLLFGLRLYASARLPASLLLVLSFVAFALIGLSVSMIDGYRGLPDGRMVPAPLVTYARETEFSQDIHEVRRLGVATFLAKFAKPAFFERLSLHTKTHPAGPVVFLWMVRRSIGHGLLGLTLATVLFGALAVWPLYWIGQALYGPAAARMALPLYLLMPSVVLFSTTSMDAVFATTTILALALFLEAAQSRLAWTVAFGLALAFASFLTYASIFVPIFAVVYALAAVREDRGRGPHLFRVLMGAALTVVASYALLYLATGYDPIAAARAAIGFDRQQMGSRHDSLRLYLNLGVAHLVAFFVAAGLPVSILWARRTLHCVVDAARGRRLDLFVLTFLASVVLMAFSTLFTMEVERIWLCMAPCVAIPAACALAQLAERERRVSLYWAASLLAAQTLAFEATLRTMW